MFKEDKAPAGDPEFEAKTGMSAAAMASTSWSAVSPVRSGGVVLSPLSL